MSEDNGGKFNLNEAIEQTQEYQAALEQLDNEDMVKQEREDVPKHDPSLVITPADQVKKEEVKWLWYPYLPQGKLCLLGGDPGQGKTFVALSIAASFSRGKWPFLIEGKPSRMTAGNTLYCVSEDGMGDTLVQRLDDMGATLKRVQFFEGKRKGKGIRRVLMNEENELIQAIEQSEAQLVVFDPLQRFLPGNTKMNDMESVSQIVSTLIQIGQQTGATILLLGHLNKSKHDTLAYKFTGSIDWFASARSALMVIPDPDSPTKEGRYLYQIKNSLAPQAEGVQFAIRRSDLPQFTWGNRTTVTAEAMIETGPNGKRLRKDDAKDFIMQELADGEKESEMLIEAAKKQGISRNAMFEAKKDLRIHHRRDAITTKWLWFFPLQGES